MASIQLPPIDPTPSFGLFRAGYIYVLKCPDTELVRYIGKSFSLRRRAFEHSTYSKSKTKRNKRNRWIYELNLVGKRPILEIIDDCDEFNWQEKERAYIRLYKACGANLLNMTDGGEPGAKLNFKHTKSAKERISEALRKRHLSAKDTYKKISEALKKRYREDPEYREKVLSRLNNGNHLRKYMSGLTEEEKLAKSYRRTNNYRRKQKFLFCDFAKVKREKVKTNSRFLEPIAQKYGMTTREFWYLEKIYVKNPQQRKLKNVNK